MSRECPICGDPVDLDGDYIDIELRHFEDGSMSGLGADKLHADCWETVLSISPGDTELIDP